MGDQMFLMVKRDLYEMPAHCGYTGVKDRAGRYTLAECAEFAPNKYSPMQDGWYVIAEDDAPEYTNKCFWDIREAHLKEKLPGMQAEIERMHECLDLVLDAKSLSEAKSAAIVGLPTEHSKEAAK